jgi:hypothetical protein
MFQLNFRGGIVSSIVILNCSESWPTTHRRATPRGPHACLHARHLMSTLRRARYEEAERLPFSLSLSISLFLLSFPRHGWHGAELHWLLRFLSSASHPH